jgi:transposase
LELEFRKIKDVVCPELNPVELIWRALRGNFNNKTFKSLDEGNNNLIMASNDDTKDHNKIKRLTQSFIQCN